MKSTYLPLAFDPSKYMEYYVAIYSKYNWRKNEKKPPVKSKYKNLDIKLEKLDQQQTITPREKHSFHSRIINNTNITFTNNHILLLESVFLMFIV